MKKRMTQRDAYELARPVQAHRMEANISMKPIGMRAPYLSQTGPLTKRKKMVPVTKVMLDVQTCCLFRSSIFTISGRRGAMANLMKKAMKKANHYM